jgi:hypothetical protein
MTRRLVILLSVLVVALVACRKSRSDECDYACIDAKEAAAAASAKAVSARADEEKRKQDAEHQAAEDWRLRAKIIRNNLEDAKRLSVKSVVTNWATYTKSARANVDHFRTTKVAQTPAWIELDALVTATQRELEAQPRKSKAIEPVETASVIRGRYRCRDGKMVVMVSGFDPCLSPALEVCDRGSDEDRQLIDLATLGCVRVSTDKDSIEVCCPPSP